jgi:hypothetical protein
MKRKIFFSAIALLLLICGFIFNNISGVNTGGTSEQTVTRLYTPPDPANNFLIGAYGDGWDLS